MVATARLSDRCSNSRQQTESLSCKRLWQLPRATRDDALREKLSKDMWKEPRNKLKQRRTRQVSEVLDVSRELNRLEDIHRQPVKKVTRQRPDLKTCADALTEVYTNTSQVEADAVDGAEDVDAVPSLS